MFESAIYPKCELKVFFESVSVYLRVDWNVDKVNSLERGEIQIKIMLLNFVENCGS